MKHLKTAAPSPGEGRAKTTSRRRPLPPLQKAMWALPRLPPHLTSRSRPHSHSRAGSHHHHHHHQFTTVTSTAHGRTSRRSLPACPAPQPPSHRITSHRMLLSRPQTLPRVRLSSPTLRHLRALAAPRRALVSSPPLGFASPARGLSPLRLRAVVADHEQRGMEPGRPLRVGLVCGGPSGERGVSLNSARSVLDHIQVLINCKRLFRLARLLFIY